MSDDDMPAPAAAPAAAFDPVVAAPSARRRRGGGRTALYMVLAVLLFAAGVMVAIWAVPRFSNLWTPGATMPSPAVIPARRPSALALARAADPQSLDLMAVRIAELEDRLTRITVEAQGASGNAARAEGLLIAVAARRALDSGTPLGYVEGQLRLRFGQAQPRAVATIINAAREPVTLANLQGELEEIAPRLVGNPPGTSWWTAMKREVQEMVVIRKATTPSPLPDRALRRAEQQLAGGRVDAALAIVDTMPGREAADHWMQMARRYMEARRAIDLIETAAILEPRQMRAGDGSAVDQSSPLAP